MEHTALFHEVILSIHMLLLFSAKRYPFLLNGIPIYHLSLCLYCFHEAVFFLHFFRLFSAKRYPLPLKLLTFSVLIDILESLNQSESLINVATDRQIVNGDLA